MDDNNDQIQPNDVHSIRNRLRKQNTPSKTKVKERLKALSRPSQKQNNLDSISYSARSNESTGYEKIRHELYKGLVDILNPQAVARASIDQVTDAIQEYVNNALAKEDSVALSLSELDQLNEDLLYEIIGLGPLTPLMMDATISDILVNGAHQIFIERNGLLEKTDIRFHDEEHLLLSIERILSMSGRRVDESSPLADARLPDGSRVNVVIPPIAMLGASISIRRFAVRKYSLDMLVIANALTPNAAEFLKKAAEGGLNIVISGGTGSGKTTFLNSIAAHINEGERIVTIEDTAELRLPHEHVVSLEARPANVEGQGEISIRALLKNALRMRPDRIIVGETRGGEALDMMQAMNTGHEGSMTTVHANSPRDALSRMETMMLMADVDLPQRVLREQIGSAVHIICQLARLHTGERRVMSITEISGIDAGVILSQELFTTKRENGQMIMRSSEHIPECAELIYQNGVDLDETIFRN